MSRTEIIDIIMKHVNIMEFEEYTELVPNEIQAMREAIRILEDTEAKDDFRSRGKRKEDE